jgi:hypothetical protein
VFDKMMGGGVCKYVVLIIEFLIYKPRIFLCMRARKGRFA